MLVFVNSGNIINYLTDKKTHRSLILARSMPESVPEDHVPVFITLSLPDKKRYKHMGVIQFWEDYDVNQQLYIMNDMLVNAKADCSTNPQTKFDTLYGCFELNKHNNVHFHGIIFIGSRYAWDINIGNIAKKLKKACQCGTYGIKVEFIKHFEQCKDYITKRCIAFYDQA